MLRTFAAAQRAHAQKLRKEAERDPLVAAVLEQFPGAEIISMTDAPSDERDAADKRE